MYFACLRSARLFLKPSKPQGNGKNQRHRTVYTRVLVKSKLPGTVFCLPDRKLISATQGYHFSTRQTKPAADSITLVCHVTTNLIKGKGKAAMKLSIYDTACGLGPRINSSLFARR